MKPSEQIFTDMAHLANNALNVLYSDSEEPQEAVAPIMERICYLADKNAGNGSMALRDGWVNCRLSGMDGTAIGLV